MSGIKLKHIYNDQLGQLGDDFLTFIHHLGGATVLHLEGYDNSRCRVLVTLLHGNEPSGIKAIQRFIRQQKKPATATKVIIASVVAAKTEPLFHYRMLDGQRDLNRCFEGPFDDLQGQLALAIIEQLREFKPEAIVDMHNTSGSGPAFCVSAKYSSEHLNLSSLFTKRTIFSDIQLGSIMEQDFNCPIITVEAGGSYDPQSDQNAYDGLCQFLHNDVLFELKQQVEVLLNPRRLEVLKGVNLGFADKHNAKNDITLRQDLEKFNFGLTPEGTSLGWLNSSLQDCFKLDKGNEQLIKAFTVRDGELITQKTLKLFMVTTRTDIALSDCVFYFVVS